MVPTQFAFITPQRYALNRLNSDLPSRYHLLLAQEIHELPELIRQKCIRYWLARRTLGHHIILDNGAYECGAAMNDDTYAAVVNAIQPHELVLPDVLYDAKESLKKAFQFYSKFGKKLNHIEKVAVLQIDTRNKADNNFSNEIMEQIEQQMHVYHTGLNVRTFCIPRHFGHDRKYGRATFLKKFNELWQQNTLWQDKFSFHMLGLASISELGIFPEYKWIRGIDSANAFTYAHAGCLLEHHIDQTYNKRVRRPKDFFRIGDLGTSQILYDANIKYILRTINNTE